MKSLPSRSLVDCALFTSQIDSYVDGELDPAHALDMEGHVLSCSACADRVTLLRALRQSVRRTSVSHIPVNLRSRCEAALVRERDRESASYSNEAMTPRLIGLRYAVGLAAAAGVVFAMGMARYRQNHHAHYPQETRAGVATDTASAVGFDTLIEDLVSLHAHPLPPETTNPEELQRWDPFVGVPVRRPTLQPFGGNFRGARVLANADRRGALLQYTVLGSHRVTVYVFDPRAVPVQATRLEARLVRDGRVYVGHVRGYSVAAAEQRGVGYALATDLDDDKSTEMVLAVLQQ